MISAFVKLVVKNSRGVNYNLYVRTTQIASLNKSFGSDPNETIITLLPDQYSNSVGSRFEGYYASDESIPAILERIELAEKAALKKAKYIE